MNAEKRQIAVNSVVYSRNSAVILSIACHIRSTGKNVLLLKRIYTVCILCRERLVRIYRVNLNHELTVCRALYSRKADALLVRNIGKFLFKVAVELQNSLFRSCGQCHIYIERLVKVDCRALCGRCDNHARNVIRPLEIVDIHHAINQRVQLDIVKTLAGADINRPRCDCSRFSTCLLINKPRRKRLVHNVQIILDRVPLACFPACAAEGVIRHNLRRVLPAVRIIRQINRQSAFVAGFYAFNHKVIRENRYNIRHICGVIVPQSS